MESKVERIKKLIKSKSYDFDKAIKSSAEKIANNPEVLLWR